MTLADLDPFLILDAGNHGNGIHRLPPERAAEGQGLLLMRCPCGTGHALLVWFDRAVGGGPPASAGAVPLNRWGVSGSGLHDLTLSPSIDSGCWHGWIKNGEATP